MALQERLGAASTLPPHILAQLAESLEPIRKDAAEIRRRNTREAMLSVSSPGYGKFSALAVRLIGECARRRGQDSPFPEAVRVLRGKVPGYFLLEPVVRYDDTDPEQYRLRWYKGFRVAKIDLLPALQPVNLDVPKGHVMEVAVSLETLPGAGAYMVLHVGEAQIRPRRSRRDGAAHRRDDRPGERRPRHDGGSEREAADAGRQVAGSAAPQAPPAADGPQATAAPLARQEAAVSDQSAAQDTRRAPRTERAPSPRQPHPAPGPSNEKDPTRPHREGAGRAGPEPPPG